MMGTTFLPRYVSRCPTSQPPVSEGYEAVRELLDRLRILEVKEDLLRAVFDRCVGEPSFSDVAFAPLDDDLIATGEGPAVPGQFVLPADVDSHAASPMYRNPWTARRWPPYLHMDGFPLDLDIVRKLLAPFSPRTLALV